MSNNKTTPAVVVSGVSSMPLDQAALQLAFFNPDGTPFDFSGAGFDKAVAVATITTPNATDLATAEALANQNKTTINDLLAKLRTAGILLP